MRNLDNALADTLLRFQPRPHWRILPDPDIQNRWRIHIWTTQDSLLEVEILDLEGTPVGCVLQRKRIPFRTMQRFMDTLMDALESDGSLPPGGAPVY